MTAEQKPKIKRDKNGRFVAGTTPNPKGRPKKDHCINDVLRKIGRESSGPEGMTKLEIVLRKVYVFAAEGRPWAVNFIADRTEGKAVERVLVQEHRTLDDMTNEELDALLGE